MRDPYEIYMGRERNGRVGEKEAKRARTTVILLRAVSGVVIVGGLSLATWLIASIVSTAVLTAIAVILAIVTTPAAFITLVGVSIGSYNIYHKALEKHKKAKELGVWEDGRE